MLVFRVEDANGMGPYQDSSANTDCWTLCADHADMFHPSPLRDSKLRGISPDEFCALDSPEALLRWFRGWLERLAEFGFVVTIYNARYARVGENGQALFRKERATLRDTLDIDTFLGLFA